MKKYAQVSVDLVAEIAQSITPRLLHKPFQGEVNYSPCEVKILEDDHATIWVKWGSKYDCRFEDLPAVVMGTIADAVLGE